MKFRYLSIITLITLTVDMIGQVDLSDFSPRLRTEMAEEEQTASESDAVFQQLMTEGVNRFENQDYEEAIVKFEQASERRPINVYPPVMIEDVRLAMANHVEEVEEEPQEEEVAEESKEPELTAEERVEQMYQQELAKVYENMPPKPKEKKPDPIEEPEVRDAEGLIIIDPPTEDEEAIDQPESSVDSEPIITPIEKELNKPVSTGSFYKKETESRPLSEIQEELAREYPDGVSEKIFEEGNRVITHRIVVKDGLGNEYRKVKHGWGGVFYFKNGVSISERVWIQETTLN